MKYARLAVGHTKDDHWLASDLLAGGSAGARTIFPHLFAPVTLLEDLYFSFQFLRVEPGEA